MPVDLIALEKFWSNVDQQGPQTEYVGGRCWLWTGARTDQGYGRAYVRPGLSCGAHRALFFMAGHELTPAEFICHRCHNRACVRPSHLYIGDARTNAGDRCAKVETDSQVVFLGTLPTFDVIAEVFRRLEAGDKQKAVAEAIGWSPSRLNKFLTRSGWSLRRWTLTGTGFMSGHRAPGA